MSDTGGSDIAGSGACAGSSGFGEANDFVERAKQALAGSPIGAMRHLTVEQDGDSLTISGRVATFYQKQLAQEIVRAVVDGVTLYNAIDVT